MKHLLFFVVAIVLCLATACKIKQRTIVYDFQTKRIIEKDGKKIAGEKSKYYYRDKESLAITIKNIDRSRYEIKTEIYEINSVDSATIKWIQGFLKTTLSNDDVAITSKEGDIIGNPKDASNISVQYPKKTLVDSIGEWNENISNIGNWFSERKDNLVQLQAYTKSNVQPDISEINKYKISYKDIGSKKGDIENLIIKADKFIKQAGEKERFDTLNVEGKSKEEVICSINKNKIFLQNVKNESDSIFIVTDKLIRFVADSGNYQYYIPEFNTSSEKIEIGIKYKEKNDTTNLSCKTLKIPALKFVVSPKIGGGTGIVFIHTPNLKNYQTEVVQGTDSLRIIEKNSKNANSIAIAIFGDINFQLTPKFSMGIGIGTGINVGKDLNGNFYTGLNLGFRVADNILVSARTGVALTRQNVLLEKFEPNASYTVNSLTDGITQQSWMPGFFAGVTVSFLIQSRQKVD